MSRRLLHIIFPENVAHIYIDGRKYTRKEFDKAKQLEMSRDKFGRFVSEVSEKFYEKKSLTSSTVVNIITPALPCFPHLLVSAALMRILTFRIWGDKA